MSERTALYRLYDTDDVLLYIGVAKTFGTRWHQHAGGQPWWPQVHHQTVEWHDSRDEAEAAEEAAIGAEKPRYNIMHTPKMSQPRMRSFESAVPDGLTRLRDLALQDYEAKQNADAAHASLVDAIWEAVAENTQQVRIAKAAGLTRERIRQLCDGGYRERAMKRRKQRGETA